MDQKIRSYLKWNSTKRNGSLARCRLLLLGCYFLVLGANTQFEGSKCPEKCYCHAYYHPTDGPSLRVECKNGGMHGIPVDQLERDIHQLIISPQPSNPNFITIGPILTQPLPFFNLHDLTISNSNVPSIGEHAFWGLVNLRTLNLTGNDICIVTTETFRGLINLTSLYLDHNQIEHMASDTFRHLSTLKRLSIAHNKISSLVPRLFRLLGNLEMLNLSYNPIGDLNPEVFKDVQKLIVFKCRRCQLRRVNVQIYHLAHLIEELDLGLNLFKYLTDDDFTYLTKLKKLLLDGNQVSVIVDNVFHENSQLTHLSIASNRIALLSVGAFKNLSHLEHLDLSYNRLDKFRQQTFAPVAKNLQSIDFSGNNLPLSEIAPLLHIFPGLQGLGLAKLSLKDIPQNFFSYNAYLMSLDISFNLLTRFPLKSLMNNKYLQDLDISNNKISSLTGNDLQRLEAIATINLTPNPWKCDQCSVRPMLFFMNNTVLNETIRSLSCRYPVGLRGVYFSELNLESLDRCTSTLKSRTSMVTGLLMVLASVVVTGAIALCCTRRRGAQYYTNEEKRRERVYDHPEELLMTINSGNVSTIDSSYQPTVNRS